MVLNGVGQPTHIITRTAINTDIIGYNYNYSYNYGYGYGYSEDKDEETVKVIYLDLPITNISNPIFSFSLNLKYFYHQIFLLV